MNENEQVLREAAFQHYRAIARQAFRYIMAVGGPDALDRFEQQHRQVIDKHLDPEYSAFKDAIESAAEMVDQDLALAREKPDLI